MIVTFTGNPSLDRTVVLSTDLIPGGVHRIEADAIQPGGKGINVSLGVLRAGIPTVAVLPAGQGDRLLALLTEEGLSFVAVPIAGPVRTNIAVTDERNTTKINEPGWPLSADEVAAVEEALVEAVEPGDTVMLSGSLSPGFPRDEYARLVRLLRPVGVWVGIDTSDAPLMALGEQLAGSAPDFMKPNALELGQLSGLDGVALEKSATEGDLSGVRDAALALRDRGVREVLVTLGAAGAVLTNEDGAWYSPSPDVPVVSTVGAGDSATAGYLIARNQGLSAPERLAKAVAYGAVAASLQGTAIPSPSQVNPNPSAVVAL